MKRFLTLLAAVPLLMLAPSAFADPAGSATGGTAAGQSMAAGCVYRVAPITLDDGQQVTAGCDANGDLVFNGTFTGAVTAASGAYANGSIVNLGTATDAASCASGTTLLACDRQIDEDIKSVGHVIIDSGASITSAGSVTQIVAGTTGGASVDVYEPGASDNHRVIKNGAGTFYPPDTSNLSATINYVRYYDLGTGFNGCNSATGLIWEQNIPGNSTNGGGRLSAGPSPGIAFSTGLSQCVTGAYGNTNTTNATASSISINTPYK